MALEDGAPTVNGPRVRHTFKKSSIYYFTFPDVQIGGTCGLCFAWLAVNIVIVVGVQMQQKIKKTKKMCIFSTFFYPAPFRLLPFKNAALVFILYARQKIK